VSCYLWWQFIRSASLGSIDLKCTWKAVRHFESSHSECIWKVLRHLDLARSCSHQKIILWAEGDKVLGYIVKISWQRQRKSICMLYALLDSYELGYNDRSFLTFVSWQFSSDFSKLCQSWKYIPQSSVDQDGVEDWKSTTLHSFLYFGKIFETIQESQPELGNRSWSNFTKTGVVHKLTQSADQ
jgi:hypothetical protein